MYNSNTKNRLPTLIDKQKSPNVITMNSQQATQFVKRNDEGQVLNSVSKDILNALGLLGLKSIASPFFIKP